MDDRASSNFDGNAVTSMECSNEKPVVPLKTASGNVGNASIVCCETLSDQIENRSVISGEGGASSNCNANAATSMDQLMIQPDLYLNRGKIYVM